LQTESGRAIYIVAPVQPARLACIDVQDNKMAFVGYRASIDLPL
jgi:hypothetical protein